MDTITTTLKRQFFSRIVDRTKRIEYREVKPYWTSRLKKGQGAVQAHPSEWDDAADSGSDGTSRQGAQA